MSKGGGGSRIGSEAAIRVVASNIAASHMDGYLRTHRFSDVLTVMKLWS
jgi:hypothetical protein